MINTNVVRCSEPNDSTHNLYKGLGWNHVDSPTDNTERDRSTRLSDV